MKLTDAAIVLSSLLIVIVFALTAETDIRWVGHALAGTMSLSYSVAVVVAGAMRAGRVRKSQGVGLSGLHRKTAIYLSAILVVTFLYGLWISISHGEPVFWEHGELSPATLHGWFGLTAMVVGIIQAGPCLAIRDRRRIKRLHMILGYTLTLLLVAQTWLGTQAAIGETAELAALIPPLL